MMTLAEVLKRRIQELDYADLKECARERDIPYELFRKVISDNHLPKDKTLLLYAEKLDIEAQLLLSTAYRQRAPSEMQHLFNGHASATLEADSHMAPVLGKASCGEWLESYSLEPDRFEPIEKGDDEAFFVIAEGDSMIGGNIPSGALLLVSPAARVHNGNIVLARQGTDEFTVKRLHRQADGTTILQPMNPAYEPIIVPPQEPVTIMRIAEIRIRV